MSDYLFIFFLNSFLDDNRYDVIHVTRAWLRTSPIQVQAQTNDSNPASYCV